jgi:hypothetical protein
MYKLPDTQIRREAFAPATETAEIRSALPASKSIQLQIASVSSVRSLLSPSLLRGTRRRSVRLAEIGKIRTHQPHIGATPSPRAVFVASVRITSITSSQRPRPLKAAKVNEAGVSRNKTSTSDSRFLG